MADTITYEVDMLVRETHILEIDAKQWADMIAWAKDNDPEIYPHIANLTVRDVMAILESEKPDIEYQHRCGEQFITASFVTWFHEYCREVAYDNDPVDYDTEDVDVYISKNWE